MNPTDQTFKLFLDANPIPEGSLLYPVSATRSLMTELRKRVEEQEADVKDERK